MASIDAVFDAIVDDCQAIAAEAVRSAAEKAQKNILTKARNCLKEYYANYTPKVYKRTKQLRKAMIPIFEDYSGAHGHSFEIGVEYDSNRLKNAYRSNSWYHRTGTQWIGRDDPYFDYDSSNNGIPEPWWVLDNYLEGVHPWGQVDQESTASLLEDFFDTQLEKQITKYVQSELSAAIIRRLK